MLAKHPIGAYFYFDFIQDPMKKLLQYHFLLTSLVLWGLSGSVWAQCLPVPGIPNPSCTQVVSGGSISVNNATEVLCVTASGNVNTVNFNQAGTLIIDAGTQVSGGINANNGGTLIVRGTFDWNGAANIGGTFNIYVEAGGELNKTADLTQNGTSNLLVNAGTLNIGSNLTYLGDIYNAGTLTANGFNLNSSSSLFSNTGTAISNGFFNANSGAVVENCGTMDIAVNLEINSGATFTNYCDLIVRDFAQQLSSFDNYGVAIIGLSGGGDGFLNQGPTTLHDGSVLVTKDFLWASNGPITLNGNAGVVVATSTLNGQGQITSLAAPGRLRVSSGASLNGTGTLDLCDIDPISSGDIPTAPNVTFPAGVAALISTAPTANLNLRACDPIADIPQACSDTTNSDPCANTQIQITFSSVDPACFGDANGSISTTVSGGTAPYSYVWNSGDTTANVNGLPAGAYLLCVFDANGCVAKRSVDLVNPAPLGLNILVNGGSCGVPGSAEVQVAGGTAPYTYIWSTGDSTPTAGGLAAGSYGVTVTDANGCSESGTAVVQTSGAASASIDCCADTAICAGSMIDVPIQFTGAGPWTLTYTENGMATTLTTSQNPYLLTLAPTAVTTVELVSVSDPTCGAGNACGVVTIGTNNCSPCNNPCPRNCFSAEVVGRTVTGSCEEITLAVTCDGLCRRALSNMTVSIPCGNFVGGSTDAGFPVVSTNPNGDPNSGLVGFKVDNISNFCDLGSIDTFLVTYTVCFGPNDCGTSSCDPLVAFKAGTCVWYSDTEASAASVNAVSVLTYPNPGTGPLLVELGSVEGGAASVELVDALGRVVVAEEEIGELVPGEVATYTWDGLGCLGEVPGAGIYLLRVRIGEETLVRRIVRQ